LIHAAILTLALFIFLDAIRARAWWLRLVCGFLLVFIWTDLQYVQRFNTGWSRTIWFTTPILLLGTSAWMLLKTPQDYRVAPAFTVVFYKLAVLSPDPKSMLADFHMPEGEFLKYVGHYAYEPEVPIGDPQFRRWILSLVTPSSLGSYYWHHPDVMKKVLLFELRKFAPDLVAPFHLVWLFGLAIVTSGFCILSPRIANWIPLWPVTLLSALLAVSSFMFASMSDAVENARHLAFFQAATDLTIFSVAVSVLLSIENRLGERKPDRVRYPSIECPNTPLKQRD